MAKKYQEVIRDLQKEVKDLKKELAKYYKEPNERRCPNCYYSMLTEVLLPNNRVITSCADCGYRKTEIIK